MSLAMFGPATKLACIKLFKSVKSAERGPRAMRNPCRRASRHDVGHVRASYRAHMHKTKPKVSNVPEVAQEQCEIYVGVPAVMVLVVSGPATERTCIKQFKKLSNAPKVAQEQFEIHAGVPAVMILVMSGPTTAAQGCVFE